jgi:hypothetical protein
MAHIQISTRSFPRKPGGEVRKRECRSQAELKAAKDNHMTEISNASSNRKASILRISHAMLDKIDAVLDTMLPPPLDDALHAVRPALRRVTSDLMGVWQTCGQTACLRARRCKRERGFCLTRCLARVPADVRQTAAAALRAARDRPRLSAAP